MKTTQEKIKVMEAFIFGESIEYCKLNKLEWKDAYEPVWNWYKFDYRIKQSFTPHLFKIGDEVVLKNYEGKSNPDICLIEDMCFDKYYTKNGSEYRWRDSFDFKDQDKYILIKDVLWYWEVKYHNGEWKYFNYRFKTEEEVRNFYKLDKMDVCKKILSLGFIIPKKAARDIKS